MILNKIKYEANGCIMMTEDESLQSRIAQLHYEYYENTAELEEKINEKTDEIQCVVGEMSISNIKNDSFWKSSKSRFAGLC